MDLESTGSKENWGGNNRQDAEANRGRDTTKGIQSRTVSRLPGLKSGTDAVVCACSFAPLRGGYDIECDGHNARKAKLPRGSWRKINDPTFVEWSTIINPHYDCSAVFQIGDVDECSKR